MGDPWQSAGPCAATCRFLSRCVANEQAYLTKKVTYLFSQFCPAPASRQSQKARQPAAAGCACWVWWAQHKLPELSLAASS